MIVLQLTDCPIGLRGELTKWLFEISAGVFVGQVSARVRDSLWTRVEKTRRSGRAILVYSTNNEQKLDFRICGETWEPIDFDGLKLVLRPSASRLNKLRVGSVEARQGFSDAAKRRAAERFSSPHTSKHDARNPVGYIVLDLETTGFNPDKEEIIQFGALKIIAKEKTEQFSRFVKIDGIVPQNIADMTGVSNEMLRDQGQPLKNVLNDFIEFAGDLPIVAHNSDFDKNFIDRACIKNGMARIKNRWTDTLSLSRRLLKGRSDYKLETLAKHFDITPSGDETGHNKNKNDCEMTYLLYEKLMNLMED